MFAKAHTLLKRTETTPGTLLDDIGCACAIAGLCAFAYFLLVM